MREFENGDIRRSIQCYKNGVWRIEPYLIINFKVNKNKMDTYTWNRKEIVEISSTYDEERMFGEYDIRRTN